MVKTRKTEHHHWVPLIQISLGTKFQLKLTILIFWPDLPKKGFSGLKQKKWRPHIFYIIPHIQISLVRNFSSNWQILFFGSNLQKKVFPVKKWKKCHHHWIPQIQISLLIPSFGFNSQFCFFLTSFVQKGLFWPEYRHGILHIWISLGTKLQLKPIILGF